MQSPMTVMAFVVLALGARLTSSLHPQKLDGYMLPLKRPF